MNINNIEKVLKRYLKRKIGYTLSLLVIFLISGGITLGDDLDKIQLEKKELLEKIRVEKKRIKEKIYENLEEIKKIDKNQYELVKKADWYSKSIFESTQVQVIFSKKDSGKLKNRTKKEFKRTLDAVKEETGKDLNSAKLLSTNGMIVDEKRHIVTFDVGANIKPITPVLPTISPDLVVNISAPIVNIGALPIAPTINLPGIQPPQTPNAPIVNTPNGVNVNVDTPTQVEKIEVKVPEIKDPNSPSDKVIAVIAPIAPEGFTPTQIVAPTPPSTPVVVPPNIPMFSTNVISSGNGTTTTIDDSWLNNGVIEMVALREGDFKLKRVGSATWDYMYTGYSGINAWPFGQLITDFGFQTNTISKNSWTGANRELTTSSGNQLGFQKLVGDTKAATMLSNAKFIYTREHENPRTNLGEFVHLDIHYASLSATERNGLVIATAGLPNQQSILDAFDDTGENINLDGTSVTSRRYTWINSGKIIIEGGNTSLTNNYDHYGNSDAKASSINTGEVIFQPYFDGINYYQKYTSAFVLSLDGGHTHKIMYNGETGIIKTYTSVASIFLSGSNIMNDRLSMVNRGDLEIYGESSAGIYLKTGSTNDVQFVSKDFIFDSPTNSVRAGEYKPIKMFGDYNIGLYGATTAGDTVGNFAVDIGAVGIGNQTFTTTDTQGTILTNYNVNPSGQSLDIEGSFGILSKVGVRLTSHQIRLYDKVKNSVGVHANGNVHLSLGGGEISLEGGEHNIGVFLDGQGTISSTGDIVLKNGKGNMAIYGKGIGTKFEIKKVKAINAKDSILIYGENGTEIIVNDVQTKLSVNDVESGVVFGNGAATKITIDRLSLPNKGEEITVVGKTVNSADKGFGIMANSGAVISAKKNHLIIKKGASGVASIGTNSSIDLTGGILEFDGRGYAVYSDGNGKVNLSGTNLILKGSSTAFDLNLAPGVISPITLDANSRIKVASDDVIVFNLKNATGLNTTGLETSITRALGGALGGVNLANLIESETGVNKYKTAAVDGGSITIGNLDKTGLGATGETQAQEDGNFYYNRFLGQRLVATTTAGSIISAKLDNEHANEKFNGQIVGLEMNSSKLATANTEAAINLVSSQIIADRTDAGAGAIGVFINYGLVAVDSTSRILVEKEANVINSGAVGVYSVNGSKVTNDGFIEVGGDGSIGILGMAYREALTGEAIKDEFGVSAVGQGKVEVINNRNIELNGMGTIGIYAKNNKETAAATDTKVINTVTGVITVGNSSTNSSSVGIYGENSTISNLGKVSVGDSAVAIYAINGSKITDLGTLKLGSDSTGVYATGDTDIVATTVTLLSSNEPDTKGKTGVFYKGTGIENKTINLTIDASGFEKGIALAVENMSTESQSRIKVGKTGIGIYATGNINSIAKNTGIIDLTAENAIGMYTKSTILDNVGTINITDATQLGIYAGDTGKIKNTGTINLNVDSSMGIFAKSGANVELGTGNNIVFNGKTSVGVFAEEATVDITNNITFAENNEDKNILIYGKGSTINIGTTALTVDGVGAATTAGNKTVGIYLENTGTNNIFNGLLGALDVKNEAIGIYSKGNNNLSVNVVATDEKTTGVFVDGNSKILGTVTANGTATGGAIGIYATDGVIDVTDQTQGLTLNTTTGKGTGMYLVDGATVTGAVTVNNTSPEKNIGIYYSNGTATVPVINDADITIGESNSIGLYAADGIELVNNKNITSTTGKNNNIGSFVGSASQLTIKGNITMNDADSIGLYVENGTGINTGTVTMNGTATPNNSVVGLVASALSGETATVENKGTVIAKENIGMYVKGAGRSIGKNTGILDATGTAGKGTGVYVDGAISSFDGTGGTIKSDGVGIYLKDNGAEKIVAGTLDLGNGAVGIFASNGIVDFNVDTTASQGTGVVGVAAETGSSISGNIKTGNASLGAYLLDNTVTFNGAAIETGNNAAGATSVGLLLDDSITTYTVNNVSINAKDGVGLHLNTPTSGVRNVTYSATLTTKGGIGIFVDSGNVLDNGTGTINIDGGTGIYLATGGTANLGIADTLTFNFLTGSGTGIFNDGGNLTLGNNVNIVGSGSLAVVKNGDLTSAGNLNIGEGAVGILGEYDSITTTPKSLINNGTITVHTGGKGIVAIKGNTAPTGLVTITNNGTINVSGESSTNEQSIGIYTDIAEINNTNTINIGDKGIGIFADNTGKDVNAGNITITSSDGIGVYLTGATGNFTGNSITGVGTGIIYEGTAPTLSIGTVALGDGSKGVLINGTGTPAATTTVLSGSIAVGDSTLDKTAIGLVVQNGANVTIAPTTTVTSGGIGIVAKGATVSDVDLNNVTVGPGGVYLYSENSSITLTSGNFTVDAKTGIYAKNSSLQLTSGTLTTTVLNGGLGIYLEGGTGLSLGNITVQNGLGNGTHSIGVYYKNMTGTATLGGISQSGDFTIGSVLDTANGTTGNLNLTSSSNSVGVALRGTSTLTTKNIDVSGDKNIGIHSLGGTSIVNGNIDVFNSLYSSDKSLSSIGIFTNGGSVTANGDLLVGDNSIGIYGELVGNVSLIGDLTLGGNSLGVYATGNSGNSSLTVTGTTHQVAANNTIGVFGENINTIALGDFIIGNGTSIGVVSKGTGDITTTGDMLIGEQSIGIYKIDGSGDITVGIGTFAVDKKGYGIYLSETSGAITNNADITLGESAIGIYSKGTNVINNNGIITVGKTNFGPNNNPAETANHLNSVGIFMSGGTTATNIGIINVTETLSVGVYGSEAGNHFENVGTMNIDNGGVGILVKNGAIAVNNGTINVGGTVNSVANSIGMAAYIGSTIINNTQGIINVTDGIGMLVGTGGVLDNKGTINIVNGTGIYGDGQIKNSGTITVTGSGTQISDGTVTSTGGVQIDKNGNVTINGNYASIGGTLVVDGTLDINGSFVDVTTGKPVFEADNITGNVNILPNFALTGNGYTYEIEGFLNSLNGSMTGSKVVPILSPLWIADIDRDGSLIIVKKPYTDLTIGDQFDNLDKGLDNILIGNGNIEDKDILKNINHYLSGLSGEDYAKEAGRVLGETRGDIYSTIQARMNTIDNAFNSSFNDLEQLYNQTKDSNKYGVIYSKGDFKDSTVGIDDYKYNITGLMYVHENENVEYKSKFGYSLGFAVSKFDFDDNGKSKEDVYSLRVGIHRMKEVSNEIEWKIQINGTFNYHEAKRKMSLGYGEIENKGKYSTYSVGIENRLTKDLFQDYNKSVKVYTGTNLRYGSVDSFDEKGNLKLELKGNDYYSIKPEIGLNSEYKHYVSNNLAVSLFGNVGLEYELGKVYDGNKAKLKDGGEGYYSLITPEKEKGSFVFKAGTKFEQFNKFDIILESEGIVAENKDDIEMKYSMKFNYVF